MPSGLKATSPAGAAAKVGAVKDAASAYSNVEVLSTEVEKSKGYIARAEGQAKASGAAEPSLLTAD